MPSRSVIRRQIARVLAVATLLGALIATTGSASTTNAATFPGCTIQSTLRLGARGEAVHCVEQALSAAGHQWTYVDRYFGTATVMAVRSFQRAAQLPVTGVVDGSTARRLGVWPSPTTTVPETTAPATTDTTDPTSTTGPTSTTEPTGPSTSLPALPGCHPTGRSAVIDKSAQRFWLCRDGSPVTDRLPMTSGSVRYGLPPVGSHTVYFKSSVWSGGGYRLSRFVAFYRTPRGNNIAFHQTVPTQPEATIGELGWRGRSAGCIRLTSEDAQTVWDFLQVGDRVNVVTR